MYLTQYLLFGILILLGLGAVIAFSYFIVKPMQTRWAVSRARKIVACGRLPGEWHLRNIYRLLATAHNDMEAEKLWRQLDGMMQVSRNHDHHELNRFVGIIPRSGKF